MRPRQKGEEQREKEGCDFVHGENRRKKKKKREREEMIGGESGRGICRSGCTYVCVVAVSGRRDRERDARTNAKKTERAAEKQKRQETLSVQRMCEKIFVSRCHPSCVRSGKTGWMYIFLGGGRERRGLGWRGWFVAAEKIV